MTEADKNAPKKTGCFSWIMLVVVIFWMVGMIIDKNPSKNIQTNQKKVEAPVRYVPPSEDKTDRAPMAFVQCQNFVKEKLISPSTADFPFFDHYKKKIQGQMYRVQSYVDSQNAFGAKIRNKWDCKIQYIKGDDADQDSWKLLGLGFN